MAEMQILQEQKSVHARDQITSSARFFAGMARSYNFLPSVSRSQPE
jgi:hypothetical protein